MINPNKLLYVLRRSSSCMLQGAVFPCNHAIWSKWAPPLERTTLVTMAISGKCTVVISMSNSKLFYDEKGHCDFDSYYDRACKDDIFKRFFTNRS